MAPVTPTSYSLSSSPFSSPNLGALLKIKVITWSQETGLPVSIRVRVGNKIFNLHRFPLASKSGYFKKKLSNETSEIELPGDFPGGADTFEMIALFIYGSSSLIDPFNVASLRCAADFLEMTEEHCSGNLCERFDLYLNQVVLQSWDDTLIVLQRCQILLPWSEDLLIVSRCIESLAFMACMEILDPEGRRDTPVVTMEELASQSWSCEMKDMVPEELWIKDLIALPFDFFKRVIRSLRRQGMKEKYVSPIIVFYANKWLLSRKTPTQFSESDILHGLVDLLPISDNKRSISNNNNNGNINKASSKVIIPIGFYFALLSKYLELGLKDENIKRKLQDQITALLHFAHEEDFLPLLLVPDYSVSTMENIVSKYVASNSEANHSPVDEARCYRVAELWDLYLFHVIDANPEMEPKRFMELIETIPAAYRHSHDRLYRAINNFLKTSKEISQEEKGAICKNLSCQKLSQETCIEAVQDELMPLRLIVQALFVQQLNTHQTFKECSDSFRYANGGATEFLSGSLSSSRCPYYSKSQNLAESPYTATADGPDMGSSSGPLGLLLQKDMVMMQKIKFSTTEYEATSFRIQNLEQELLSLKRSLQMQNIELSKSQKKNMIMAKPLGLEGRSMSKKRNGLGQASSCISSVNFASQRKYASRILKLFRRLTWFASRKSKRKPATPSHWSNSM